MSKINTIILFLFVWCSCANADPVDGQAGNTPAPDGGGGEQTETTIQTYSYPDVIINSVNGYLKKSTFYSVEVSDGTNSRNVYVMSDRNTFQLTEPGNAQGQKMTNHNNTANFSFSGTVRVRVKRLDGGSLSSVKVYPKQKNYSYSVKSDHVEITLDKWAYIYVEFYDLIKEPLFIFADPLEQNTPQKESAYVELLTPQMTAEQIKQKISSTSKSIIYFSEGVYDFDPAVTDDTYQGYRIPLISNKQYYIPGGAVIVGSFAGDASNSKIFGRGVITGCGKQRLANESAIPYNLYMGGSGTGNIIEGIHFNNPPHFAILSRGQLTTQYTKMFGWYHQTDGWGAEDNSKLLNSFVKANDDFIKVYRANQTVENIVVYKQINGAAIQLGWNAYGSASNCVVDGLYVVRDDDKDPGTAKRNNTSVINLVSNGGSPISNVTIKNVYVENNVQCLVGLNLVGGSISGLTIENMQHTGNNLCGINYLYAKNRGTYSNIKFKNLYINGTKITSDAAWGMVQKEATDNPNGNDILTPKSLTTIIYE